MSKATQSNKAQDRKDEIEEDLENLFDEESEASLNNSDEDFKAEEISEEKETPRSKKLKLENSPTPIEENEKEDILSWMVEYVSSQNDFQLMKTLNNLRENQRSTHFERELEKRQILCSILELSKKNETLLDALSLFEKNIPSETENRHSIHQEFKGVVIVSILKSSDANKLDLFRETVKKLIYPHDTRELRNDIKQLDSFLFDPSSGIRKEDARLVLKKYDLVNFYSKLENFIKFLNNRYLSLPFLERVYNDTINYLYIPHNPFTEKDLLEAFDGTSKQFEQVKDKTDVAVSNFLNYPKDQKTKKRKRNRKSAISNDKVNYGSGEEIIQYSPNKSQQLSPRLFGSPIVDRTINEKYLRKYSTEGTKGKILNFEEREANSSEEESGHYSPESESDDEILQKSKTLLKSRPYESIIAKREKLPDGKRRHRPWTEEETDLLIKAIATFGLGKWSKMIEHFNFYDRTPVDLKDRWRVLLRSAPESCIQLLKQERELMAARKF